MVSIIVFSCLHIPAATQAARIDRVSAPLGSIAVPSGDLIAQEHVRNILHNNKIDFGVHRSANLVFWTKTSRSDLLSVVERDSPIGTFPYLIQIKGTYIDIRSDWKRPKLTLDLAQGPELKEPFSSKQLLQSVKDRIKDKRKRDDLKQIKFVPSMYQNSGGGISIAYDIWLEYSKLSLHCVQIDGRFTVPL